MAKMYRAAAALAVALNLAMKSDVLNDEDHVSVAPRGFTKGLKYLLPAPLAGK